MATTVGSAPHFARLLQGASISNIVTSILAILFVRWIVTGIYRVYFHPLSRFPGPRFSAFTRIPINRALWTGSVHRYTQRLHQVYGDIVRIAPDEVSFIGPTALNDIYGRGSKGTPGKAPPKHWGKYGVGNSTPDLIRAPDADHARMRKIFTPAFSDRALKQQEPLFAKYVDKLVAILRRELEKDPQTKFDMVRMYNFTTFDVMGDLTFGEPLHMLDNGEYDAWVSTIFKGVKIAQRVSLFQNYPGSGLLDKGLRILSARSGHNNNSIERVEKRLAKGRESEGTDLWDLVLSQEEGKGLSRGEMNVNSSLFMVAGTETTATVLSGLTWLLLKDPEAMEKIVNELRTTFTSTDEMSMEAIAALPYLNACIKEALRMYPPVAGGLPHLTPAEGSTICGEFVPPGAIVSTPHWSYYTNERHFKDAEKFVPERWLGDERYVNDERSSVQPFSVGPRDCLGKNMAYHEMRLILSRVLFNFDMELSPESDNWIDQNVYILWEKHPLMVKLRDARA